MKKRKVKRSNLISSMTADDFKMMNENSKNANGLGNLTYKQLYLDKENKKWWYNEVFKWYS